jgi:hypothetical protein
MASRREFLQAGLASLALPISAHATFSSGIFPLPDEPSPTPLYKVVYDERFAASRAFASEAKSLHATVHGIQGDITDLWFNDLYARWRQGPAAIAGLTAHGALFCLERLAWDQQMRVVFRAEHRYRGDGHIEHRLAVPESMTRQAALWSDRGPDWASSMANLITGCPGGLSPSQAQALKMKIVAPVGRSADHPSELLISWVIAPVVRATTSGESTNRRLG